MTLNICGIRNIPLDNERVYIAIDNSKNSNHLNLPNKFAKCLKLQHDLEIKTVRGASSCVEVTWRGVDSEGSSSS